MSLRFLLISLVILYGAWMLLGAWDIQKSDRLNVIFLTVESLRADLVTPETTPNLLKAAAQGEVFEAHRGASAWTGAGVVSLLSGTSAFEHGVHSGQNHFAKDQTSALTVLSAQGWDVVGLQPFMKVGVFDNLGLKVQTDGTLQNRLLRYAKDQTPFVFWYHYLETHLPYSQSKADYRFDWQAEVRVNDSEQFKRLEAVASYPNVPAASFTFEPEDQAIVTQMHRASVREFDQWFGDFWELFNKSGLVDNTILIVTADHGDEHGERGKVGHASTTKDGHLYEEIVRLPLIVWSPDKIKMNVDTGWTTHTDVMPMVFRQLGVPPLDSWRHRAPVWVGMTSRAGFAETNLSDPARYVYGAFDGRWKLQAWRTAEGEWSSLLFDLREDAGELAPLQGEDGVRKRLLDEIEKMRLAYPVLSTVRSSQTTSAPQWLAPSRDRSYAYDDLKNGCFELSWSDVQADGYVIEFEAGQGRVATQGRVQSAENRLEYCGINYLYWKSFIEPYKSVKLRVAPQNTENWSDWRVLKIKEGN